MLQTIERSLLPERIQAAELDIIVCPADELPENYAQQIIDKSRQPHIAEAFEGWEDIGTEETPGRFRNLDTYYSWAEKGRLLYALANLSLNPGDKGAPDIGIIDWYGEKPTHHAPGRLLTRGIRGYQDDPAQGWAGYQGKRLATPFADGVHAHLSTVYPNEGIWLDVAFDNTDAKRLYGKTGYIHIDTIDDDDLPGRTTEVWVNDTALKVEA